MFYCSIIVFFLLFTQSVLSTAKNGSKDGDASEAGMNTIWIIVALVIIFIIGTCVYIYLIFMAIRRKACFSNLDVSKSRQSAGADKFVAGKEKNKMKKDPSVDQSVQHRTAAYDYDNFGNLTTDETTTVTKEDKGKKKKTVSNQIVELIADKDPIKPPSEQKLPPPPPPPPPSSTPVAAPRLTVTVKFVTGITTKKSEDKLSPDVSQEPQNNGNVPATSTLHTPLSIGNTKTENEVKPIPPVDPPPDRNARDSVPPLPETEAPETSKLFSYEIRKRKEASCCEMVCQGTLRKERPGLFRVLVILTVIYIIFVLCLIGLAVFTSML